MHARSRQDAQRIGALRALVNSPDYRLRSTNTTSSVSEVTRIG